METYKDTASPPAPLVSSETLGICLPSLSIAIVNSSVFTLLDILLAQVSSL